MRIELQYRYVVVKAEKNEPLRYYHSRPTRWEDNIREAEFFYCVDTAILFAEMFDREAQRGRRKCNITYSAIAIKADEMPYKSWMNN